MADRESPVVQFFTYDDPRKVRTLRERIQKMQMDAVIQCGSGYAQNWEDYKERVGGIKALNQVIELFDQVYKEGQ